MGAVRGLLDLCNKAPREWKGDFVRMSFTTPLVRFPVR